MRNLYNRLVSMLTLTKFPVTQRVSLEGGDMASAGARAYSGGLGAESPAGSGGRNPLKLKAF